MWWFGRWVSLKNQTRCNQSRHDWRAGSRTLLFGQGFGWWSCDALKSVEGSKNAAAQFPLSITGATTNITGATTLGSTLWVTWAATFSSTIQANGKVTINAWANGLQYTDGNQAAGKVLQSDASGNASWQSPPWLRYLCLTGTTTASTTNCLGQIMQVSGSTVYYFAWGASTLSSYTLGTMNCTPYVGYTLMQTSTAGNFCTSNYWWGWATIANGVPYAQCASITTAVTQAYLSYATGDGANGSWFCEKATSGASNSNSYGAQATKYTWGGSSWTSVSQSIPINPGNNTQWTLSTATPIQYYVTTFS